MKLSKASLKRISWQLGPFAVLIGLAWGGYQILRYLLLCHEPNHVVIMNETPERIDGIVVELNSQNHGGDVWSTNDSAFCGTGQLCVINLPNPLPGDSISVRTKVHSAITQNAREGRCRQTLVITYLTGGIAKAAWNRVPGEADEELNVSD